MNNVTESIISGLGPEDETRFYLSIERLKTNLLQGYDKVVAPLTQLGKPIELALSMSLSHFELVNQKKLV